MFSWNKKNEFIKLVNKRIDRYLEKIHNESCRNLYFADLWGKTHIALGLSTILFSTASTILAFNQNTNLVALLTFIATVLASFLTFINPSKREARRRIAYQKLSF